MGRGCAVLGDSSRRILASGEFDAETTENSIKLHQEAMDNFAWLTEGCKLKMFLGRMETELNVRENLKAATEYIKSKYSGLYMSAISAKTLSAISAQDLYATEHQYLY
ncbi:MAG: hypothetical protein WB392_05495 [Methanotrichaceae archaeon]